MTVAQLSRALCTLCGSEGQRKAVGLVHGDEAASLTQHCGFHAGFSAVNRAQQAIMLECLCLWLTHQASVGVAVNLELERGFLLLIRQAFVVFSSTVAAANLIYCE